MQPATTGQPQSHLDKPKGFIMIITVIVTAALLSVVVIKTALGTITELDTSFVDLKGIKAKNTAGSCIQEALIKLNRDNDYTGENLTFNGDGNCQIVVSGSDTTKTIAISTETNDYYNNLNVSVNLDPFEITTWDN